MATILVWLRQRLRTWALAGHLLVASLLGCLGCAQTLPSSILQSTANLHHPPSGPSDDIQLAQYTQLPPPQTLPPAQTGQPVNGGNGGQGKNGQGNNGQANGGPGPMVPVDTLDHGDKTLPINLDTVLRLACDKNGEINLAREKLNEAFANKAIADKAWLPEIDVGLSYYRHEGGIQDETGQFLHSSFGSLFAGLEIHGQFDLKQAVYQRIQAEQKLIQQKSEVSRLSAEQLLQAANAYIDLLTARTGEVISRETEERLRSVLEKSKKLAKEEKGYKIDVLYIQAQVTAQQQTTRDLQALGRIAAARLLQLLHLDPHAQLAVMDPRLVAFPLIPANTPTDELVAIALHDGPGVPEMEEMLAMLNDADAKAHGPSRFLPIFEVRLAEGAFGAGPNDTNVWDNRLDIALQARWNLTNLCTARDRQWAAKSKIQQEHIAYDNLRVRLTLDVQEAVETSASAVDMMQLAQREIDEARAAYKLSETRLEFLIGAAPTEVMRAAQGVGSAQINYLNALRNYDKAQIRLLIVTGKTPCAHPH
jgi:outer membrane protein TolC